ncbi:MAG: membrane protein insertase YidC [Planctomycetota bacterium]
MAKKPNTVLRLIVPAIGTLIAVFIAYSVFKQSSPQTPVQQPGGLQGGQATPQAQGQPPLAAEPESELTTASAQDAPALPQAGPASAGASAQPATVPLDAVLAAETYPDEPVPAPLGTPAGESMLFIEFSRYGGGIESIRLTDEFVSVEAQAAAASGAPVLAENLVQVQTERVDPVNNFLLTPFVVQGIEVGGRFVGLVSGGEDGTAPVWRSTGPGTFEAYVTIDGQRAVRVERRFSVPTGSHTIELAQSVENLTDVPYAVRLYMLGPVEMTREAEGYGGDRRRVRFGYLANTAQDPGREYVLSDDYLWPRNKALGDREDASGLYAVQSDIWPNRESLRRDRELVWAGLTTRYHGVVVRPAGGDDATQKSIAPVAETVDRVLLNRSTGEPMALRLVSPRVLVAANSSADLSAAIYAGPLSKRSIRTEPGGRAFGLDGLVVYNFGGPCGFCTFPVLTNLLLWILLNLHSVTFDWALSIILLVVVVRSCLHPITRWSQIKIQIFGKQMQGLAPKQAKIKEKYGDDPKQMQAEMAKLWREEGINPAGLLGCLPMFLQSPVWIALYATLYFSIELRQEPAFFGVFQQIGGWTFMGDLSEPDRAIPVPRFDIPLLSSFMGPITGVNFLPVLLGVVFYAHQKYLTPTSSVALTPEQEQQQKIMRVMTVFLFPVIMYNAPSGLALYFITNSLLGIVESRWIRSSAEKKGLLDLDQIRAKAQARKAGKPGGGFMARLQQVAEEQQRRREAIQRNPNQPAPGTGKRSQAKYGKPSTPGSEPPPNRFKKKK